MSTSSLGNNFRVLEPISGSAYLSDALEQPQPWVEVLVDCPGAQELFIYHLPSSLEVHPGDILSVAFGSQQVGAIAIRLLSQLPPELEPTQIREVEEVISAGFFPGTYWRLLEQVARYYHTPLIQAIRVALPPGLLARSQRRIRLIVKDLPPTVPDLLSPAACQLLQLLQANSSVDYTWKYLQHQVKGAQRGLRELSQRGWVQSYLKPQSAQKPKCQQAVTLLSMAPADLTGRQREILDVLKQRGGDLWLQDLLQSCKTSTSTLKALEKKGCVAIESRQRLRLESGPRLAADDPQTLTPAQEKALTEINALCGFSQVLLHGVTGSGKTEVYLQAIAPVLQRGESALVLVPEIGLTPQLTDRFRARFGARVFVYHSALSDGERYDTWRQLLSGSSQVVIGTRSAVFAPLPNLGLIVLDEEHDPGFKQDQPAPCYHASTVARWRAELDNCPLLLGSATPSLESWVSIKTEAQGLIAEKQGQELLSPERSSSCPTLYLSLPERIQARPMPPIEVVDMRQELQQGNHSIFSRKLQQVLEVQQAQGQQGLLFIHRRGHSTFVSCRNCGYVVDCPNCSVSLTYHHSQEAHQPLLRCHYCNHVRIPPSQCPECHSPYFKYFGSGTQRVVRELMEKFPNLRLIRFDSDTTRTKGAHRALLERFAQGEADLLVGTQMLTKGLDLPQVKFVGVLAADGLLNLPDYRASERAFQTLTQVAGRAGRSNEPGQVILQTYVPEHPVIQAVQRYECEPFMATELQQRLALNYPPYGQLILLRLSSTSPDAVEKTAQSLAEFLSARLAQSSLSWELLGPAPANILRVARRYRWQILLKLPSTLAGEMSTFTCLPVAELRALCPAAVRLTIDVDPLNLL